MALLLFLAQEPQGGTPPAPVPVSWTVLADGVTLRGVFTQPITAGALTGLTASVVTLSSGAVVGGNFDITIPKVYQGADAGTITYSGSGTLAGAGGLVAAFGPTAIVNDSTQVEPTYATWSPTDKSDKYTLSDGNLKATRVDVDGSSWFSLRATLPILVKSYFELTCTVAAGSGGYMTFGVSTAAASLNTFVGGDANGWGYYGQTGSKCNNGSLSAYGSQYAENITIGIVYDPVADTLEFYNANTPQGVISTALSGDAFPAAAFLLPALEVVANFGATPFVYPVPSGCRAGVYTP